MWLSSCMSNICAPSSGVLLRHSMCCHFLCAVTSIRHPPNALCQNLMPSQQEPYKLLTSAAAKNRILVILNAPAI